MPTPTYCPTCGVPVAEGTQVCGNCGSPVHPTGSVPVVTAAPAAPAPRRGLRVAVIVVAALAIAAGAVAFATRAGAAAADPGPEGERRSTPGDDTAGAAVRVTSDD